MLPLFDSVDHIHINVANRQDAEKWYAECLGFTRDAHFEEWVTAKGPLTLRNHDGSIHLALFERVEIQNTVIAFRVSATGLHQWVEHLLSKGIDVAPIDHDLSWSVYFRDPDGNPFEITTYEYDLFRTQKS